MKRRVVRLAGLLPVLVSLLALQPSPAEAKVTYPKPNSFKIDVPFAIGKVSLDDTIQEAAEKWGGKPNCRVKAAGTTCKWGRENAPGGMALMQTSGDINSKVEVVLIEFGEKRGDAILNDDSPLTSFHTTRGKIGLGSPAQKVSSIDPANVEEFGSGFIFPGPSSRMYFLTTGSPGNKFVTGIVLTNGVF